MAEIRKGKYSQLTDEVWLRAKYETEGMSCSQIATLVGCGKGTVERRLHQFGIQVRGRHHGHWVPKSCERCGEEFTPSGPAQRFCGQGCRAGELKCLQCGEMFTAPPSQSRKGTVYKRKYCSMDCRRAWGAENCSYRYVNKSNGYVTVVREPTMSRRVRADGYVDVNIGAENGNGGRVKEHVLVMEQSIGRRLIRGESVHHKNGDRADNRPENLELWSKSQPYGQRVEDKVSWAREILALYAPGDLSSSSGLP